ncbi:hypothetical protein AB0C65_35900 [Nocardia sp. NPDC048505]|uniref:hypothetical protein n=1 Tax=Nocardia sp. NPDC048505 TaxID=3155756 RepID=UPI0033CD6ACE
MDEEDDRYRGRGRGGSEPRKIGNRFRDGRALQMGRTESAGWKKEVAIEVSDGTNRIADNAKIDAATGDVVETVETKVAKGKLKNTRDLREQLAKDVRLANDKGIRCTWEIAAGKIPKPVAEMLARAARDTGGLFQAVELTREERNSAFQASRTLERSQAREAAQVLAQQLARLKLERDRADPALQKQRERDEAAARQQQRDRGLADAAAIAKEFAEKFLPPPAPQPSPPAPDKGEAQRQELERARLEREAAAARVAEQRREAARAHARLPRDVVHLLALGQDKEIWSSTADPSETVQSRTQAGVEARHREQQRGITRGQQ